MKKLLPILLALSLGLTACGQPAAQTTGEPSATAAPPEAVTELPAPTEPSAPAETTESGSGGNILIVYFSRAGENYNVGVIEKGNTAKVAEEIAAQTGGDLFEIVPVEAYPENYDECTNVAKAEQNQKARPAFSGEVEDWDGYDTVYLGYPIWWGDLPMVVYTFLEGSDFSGKTVYPFATHEGSGMAGTAAKITSACPDAEVKDGLAIRGSTAQNNAEEVTNLVKNWIGGN